MTLELFLICQHYPSTHTLSEATLNKKVQIRSISIQTPVIFIAPDLTPVFKKTGTCGLNIEHVYIYQHFSVLATPVFTQVP